MALSTFHLCSSSQLRRATAPYHMAMTKVFASTQAAFTPLAVARRRQLVPHFTTSRVCMQVAG